jgi:hypothetical protein
MKNREPKEWRSLQRWSKLQKRAQNETDRGKLAKILGRMGRLIIQMEKRATPLVNEAHHALVLGLAGNEDRGGRAPLRTRVLIN